MAYIDAHNPPPGWEVEHFDDLSDIWMERAVGDYLASACYDNTTHRWKAEVHKGIGGVDELVSVSVEGCLWLDDAVQAAEEMLQGWLAQDAQAAWDLALATEQVA